MPCKSHAGVQIRPGIRGGLGMRTGPPRIVRGSLSGNPAEIQTGTAPIATAPTVMVPTASAPAPRTARATGRKRDPGRRRAKPAHSAKRKTWNAALPPFSTKTASWAQARVSWTSARAHAQSPAPPSSRPASPPATAAPFCSGPSALHILVHSAEVATRPGPRTLLVSPAHGVFLRRELA